MPDRWQMVWMLQIRRIEFWIIVMDKKLISTRLGLVDDDDDGQVCAVLEIADHIQTAHQWHLQVEQYQIGPVPLDLIESGRAVIGLADNFDVGHRLQFFAQHSSRDGFVVNDQSL
jgi:hypothetical protein